MGPLMVDVEGTSLSAEDVEILHHPLTGGVILFARNYQSPQQVAQLCQEIRAKANKPLLIAVDQEGGRVQRFKQPFTDVPAMGKLWQLASNDQDNAKALCYHAGLLIALEVQSVGVDISFAPVVDLNDISDVIGDRAFHREPEKVIALASAFIQGMNAGGMQATVKHFPGHGSVKEDSHIAMPVDSRSKQQIFDHDMKPFQQIIAQGLAGAVMPAHVIYPSVDDKSVGFSEYWLQDILRKSLGFNGVIFSDDLSMSAAGSIGGHIERAEAAQAAGCDMLLLCNDRSGVEKVLDNANLTCLPASQHRISQMLAKPSVSFEQLAESPLWRNANQLLGQYR